MLQKLQFAVEMEKAALMTKVIKIVHLADFLSWSSLILNKI